LSRPSDKKAPLIRQKALKGSFSERVFFPIAQFIFEKGQAIIPLNSKSWVRSKLIQAGYLKPHFQKVFLGIQMITTAVLFLFFVGIFSLFPNVSPVTGFIISCFFALAGYGFPMLWLIQQAQKRQMGIRKSLPDFLDLLVISVEAGLGLDMAINKLANLKCVKTSEYLKDELRHYTQDIKLGKPRRDALLDMANRTGLEEFLVIINALVQSYEMGTGVANTLRVQSESLRMKRISKAEEKANKIPVKMVLPIYIFLFPSIFLAIFGPIAMVAIEAIITAAGEVG
ncbi:MAG: type II secretion system F family protein, partial [Cyanobacteria bacterium]|nr:type II secretion system F family protein [Cyanobacteriota bacterium]